MSYEYKRHLWLDSPLIPIKINKDIAIKDAKYFYYLYYYKEEISRYTKFSLFNYVAIPQNTEEVEASRARLGNRTGFVVSTRYLYVKNEIDILETLTYFTYYNEGWIIPVKTTIHLLLYRDVYYLAMERKDNIDSCAHSNYDLRRGFKKEDLKELEDIKILLTLMKVQRLNQ